MRLLKASKLDWTSCTTTTLARDGGGESELMSIVAWTRVCCTECIGAIRAGCRECVAIGVDVHGSPSVKSRLEVIDVLIYKSSSCNIMRAGSMERITSWLHWPSANSSQLHAALTCLLDTTSSAHDTKPIVRALDLENRVMGEKSFIAQRRQLSTPREWPFAGNLVLAFLILVCVPNRVLLRKEPTVPLGNGQSPTTWHHRTYRPWCYCWFYWFHWRWW